MMLRRRKFLGLLIGERSLVAAEISVGGKFPELRQVADWAFPNGLVGEPLGKALRQFLRAHRISATHTIAGIPARWLLAKEKTTPPADASTLTGLLRLEAERDFAFPAADLTLDYVENATAAGSPHRLLLLAASRNKVESLQQMARAAGLKLAAITPSLLALVNQADYPSDVLVLHIGRENVELILRSGGMPRVIRYLGSAPSVLEPAADSARIWATALGKEIRKILLLIPKQEGFIKPGEVAVWDDYGLTEPALQALQTAVHLPVKMEKAVGALPETDTGAGPARVLCSAAVVLALAGEHPRTLPIDFLHSRIAVGKKHGWRRMAARGAVAAAVLFLAVIAGLLNLRSEEHKVAELRRQLNEMQPDIAIARNAVDRVQFISGWQGREPRFLECLREATLAFPTDGSIWTTSLAIHGDMRGLVSGKAINDKSVLELLDRLKQNPAFPKVNLVFIHEAGGGTGGVAYTISFDFVQPPALDEAAQGETR